MSSCPSTFTFSSANHPTPHFQKPSRRSSAQFRCAGKSAPSGRHATTTSTFSRKQTHREAEVHSSQPGNSRPRLQSRRLAMVELPPLRNRCRGHHRDRVTMDSSAPRTRNSGVPRPKVRTWATRFLGLSFGNKLKWVAHVRLGTWELQKRKQELSINADWVPQVPILGRENGSNFVGPHVWN